MRVLVVDDSEDAANSLAAVLRVKGYEAVAETDGFAAAALAIDRRFDALLLDLQMANVSGQTICRRIRNEPAWGKDILVVAVTGWARESDLDSARDVGFDHYLLKPVDLATLDALLRSGRSPETPPAADATGFSMHRPV